MTAIPPTHPPRRGLPVRELLAVLCLIVGFGSVCAAAWMHSVQIGLVVTGVGLVIAGYLLGWSGEVGDG